MRDEGADLQEFAVLVGEAQSLLDTVRRQRDYCLGIPTLTADGHHETPDADLVGELTRQRDAYRAGGEKLLARLSELDTRLAAAQQENQRLRAALEEFGEHSPRCRLTEPLPWSCLCGLSEVLNS